MKANVVDFRYRIKNILRALDSNEAVTILYHGKEKGILIPVSSSAGISVFQHPFFGMVMDDKVESVDATMENLRSIRY